MNVNTLRQYLRDRELRSTGLKADLVASRAFVAHESNVPLVPTATEKSSMLASDFKAALQTPGDEMPTSDSLVDWESEQSMHKWPPTLIQDIDLFRSKADSFKVQRNPLAGHAKNCGRGRRGGRASPGAIAARSGKVTVARLGFQQSACITCGLTC